MLFQRFLTHARAKQGKYAVGSKIRLSRRNPAASAEFRPRSTARAIGPRSGAVCTAHSSVGQCWRAGNPGERGRRRRHKKMRPQPAGRKNPTSEFQKSVTTCWKFPKSFVPKRSKMKVFFGESAPGNGETLTCGGESWRRRGNRHKKKATFARHVVILPKDQVVKIGYNFATNSLRVSYGK